MGRKTNKLSKDESGPIDTVFTEEMLEQIKGTVHVYRTSRVETTDDLKTSKC